jgi:hypothetical protein
VTVWLHFCQFTGTKMYPMKIILYSTFAIMALAIMSCSSSRQYPPSYPNDRQQQPRVIIVNDDGRNLPSGQAKKIYGKKCAKYYAPGWCKHHNKRYRYRPTVIISIPFNLATRSNGRYFYDDDMGYRYWKGNDNDERFYLDNQYNNDACYCNLGYDDDNDDNYRRNDRRDDRRGDDEDYDRKGNKGKHHGKGKKHGHHDRDDD